VPGFVQSIERAAAVLRLLAHSPGDLALGEVSRALDLAKGTTHGILRTLQTVGFVDQDNRTGLYRLGTGLEELRRVHLDPNELRSRSFNWADALAGRTRTSVRLGILEGGEVLLVHHVFRPDDSTQLLQTGSSLPAHACALGQVLLAYIPSASRNIRDLTAYTNRTIVTSAALNARIAQTRTRGWAFERAELSPNDASLAAVIREPGGLVVGAIGISGPADQLCSADEPLPALVGHVVTTARAISRDLSSDRR
jgi:DNA-binding IclR family transcriptional regulator